MLNFKNMGLRRGNRELFSNVNITLHRGMKTGVTGRNGVGKSSLFEVVLGSLSPDSGEFSMPPSLQIAHVAQEVSSADCTALDYVLEGDAALISLQQAIADAEQCHEHEHLGELFEQMNSIDGYTAPARAASLLGGLGFRNDQLTQPVNTFSGGWRIRLNLARALMCRSDVLLLDEPTNHLDLEAVLWLEGWLRNYTGTLLLISHDASFLDNVVNHIMHIEQGHASFYTGNYTAFEKARATQLAQNAALYKKQQRDVARIRDYVARFGAKATRSRQAQSRLKALERMELVSQAHVDIGFQFSFFPAESRADPMLRLDGVDIGYGDNRIITNARTIISRGDRIAVLGRNGMGKSTLIKLLAGELAPLSGECTRAAGLKVGYFAQHQLESLDVSASPLLHLQRLDRRATEQALRDFLGSFGFVGDQALAAVGPLSGGEKSRLALALIVFQRPDMILLDEPTNHLDMDTRISLNDALQAYEGAVVLVSHDRQLVASVADRLWLVDAGQLSEYSGDLDDYIEYMRQSAREQQAVATASSGSVEERSDNRKQQRQAAARQRQQQQPLRQAIRKLEVRLEEVEQRLTEVESVLADNSMYAAENKQKLTSILQEQSELRRTKEQLEEQWLEKQSELENTGN